MTAQDEEKWRDLCREAISQHDLDKLLKIFCALDRATGQERRKEAFRKLSREQTKTASDVHSSRG